MTPLRVFIGWDPRETTAYEIAKWSLVRRCSRPVSVYPIMMNTLRHMDPPLYTREHERRVTKKTGPEGQLWDTISEAPMSTEFAITRFLTPHLAQEGWCLFIDCDMLVLGDIWDLFKKADPDYAVQVVKHIHVPDENEKMDGQIQTRYHRKNWSSAILWNCDHPSNRKLTLEMINTVPGRDLHRFCWLEDDEIGSLPLDWNYLVDVSPKIDRPLLCHYTLGTPDMPGYEKGPWAEKWWLEKACMEAQFDMRMIKEAAE